MRSVIADEISGVHSTAIVPPPICGVVIVLLADMRN